MFNKIQKSLNLTAGYLRMLPFSSVPFLMSVAVGFTLQPALAQEVLNGSISYDALLIPSPMECTVVLKTGIHSAEVAAGDAVEAVLKEDLILGEKLIALAGSSVLGQVEHSSASCRLAKAMIRGKHRFRTSGSLRITFKEIVTASKDHIQIEGRLSKQYAYLTENRDNPRQVRVGANGDIKQAENVLSPSAARLNKAINLGLPRCLSKLGTAASMGAAPVLMGVVGAVSPSTVIGKPVSLEEGHPRIRGFSHGFVDNLPGGTIVNRFVFKGSEVVLQPGDEILISVHSPYEGAIVEKSQSK